MTSTLIEQYMPKTPHPVTGEPFLAMQARFEFESGQELVEYMAGPPDRPMQSWFDSDADDYIELTEEEFVAALAAYEAAHARWVAAGSPNGIQVGVVQSRPATVTGTFITASGARATGVRQAHGGEWFWTEYTSKPETNFEYIDRLASERGVKLSACSEPPLIIERPAK